ncbi:hypothetical protein ABZ128_30810 [Streptomyces sp. NPDC006326]|uniref:hypothetical protein n=1 Tax=Streptomyces sp. NPDC006326 TaxID=3156752 RepID=UPI0033A96E41
MRRPTRTAPAAVRWLVLAVAAAMAAAGCAGPSRTEEDYRHKAANTAEAAASAVSTAGLAVKAAGEKKATGPYLSAILGEAEKDLAGADEAFMSRQPPGPASDRVRRQVGEVLSDAADELAAVRIDARRGRIEELGAHASGLAAVLDRLNALEENLS